MGTGKENPPLFIAEAQKKPLQGEGERRDVSIKLLESGVKLLDSGVKLLESGVKLLESGVKLLESGATIVVSR